MNPNSFVIEVIPAGALDSRHMPGVGVFARLSNIFQLNHYLYYSSDDNKSNNNADSLSDEKNMVMSVFDFVEQIKKI